MENFSQFTGLKRLQNHLADRRSAADDYSLLGEKAEEGDSHEQIHTRGNLDPLPQRPWLPLIKYTLCGGLFILYSVALVALASKSPSDIECGKRVSLWSPLNEAIDYYELDLNNEFDHETQYRGPPTPELEDAWGKLWRIDPIPFPADKLSEVNRSEDVLEGKKLARLGKQDDPDAPVAANFEVFHQLHCLNYLRQYTWRDWYFRHPDKVIIPEDMLASDVGVRMHADHCIEHLRTSLMCHSDTTPFFTYIDPSQPVGAKGDFSSHHKCRDFEKIQALAMERQQPFAPFDNEG